MVVLFEDECHLLWGDTCGYVWGTRNRAIEVPMTNQKARQTYYGALNFVSRTLHLQAFDAGNSQNTIAYLQGIRAQHPDKKLLIFWDGASYHRDAKLKAFLEEVNAGLSEKDWKLTLMAFAPNAPEQNPIEDCWLAGKNYLRRNFAFHKTFAQVKDAFSHFFHSFNLASAKFDWYAPEPQII